MKKEDIVVVIPIYRSLLLEEERLSLDRCVQVLSEYSLVVAKPKSLNLDTLLSEYALLKEESFPDKCFASLRAYNKMVLSESFYLRFSQYQYMLIYQLDAYVFKDELLYWANKGYDYIGAPWIPPGNRYLTQKARCVILFKYAVYTLLNDDRRKKKKICNYQVGNGGFSLRKIAKLVEVTRFYEKKIAVYLDDDRPFYPEDLFLLLELTSSKCRLRKPNFKEALKFSMEENPAWSYHYNKGELPFGCHDWSHEHYSSFWYPVIKSLSDNSGIL